MADQTKWFTVRTDTTPTGPIGAALGLPTGSFRIDPDAIGPVRAALEDAIAEVSLAGGAASEMDAFRDEAVNPVVDKYMAAMVERASGPDGSVAVAANSAAAAYQSVIDQLDQAMAAYREADDSGRFGDR